MPAFQRVIHVLRHVVLMHHGEGVADADLLRRFVRHRDEAAFETLVRRHGPLVFGVCRRVLRNQQDAEDAFQATFLVLARRAGSIRKPASLASWLHGVAHRTALRARSANARRRVKEARVMPRQEQVPGPEIDLAEVLDQELASLPEAFREAIILCDLQGKTRKEAAQALGCAEGTVASRLARGRELLARRLARLGLGFPAGALAAALAESASAAVPASLVSAAAKAAALGSAGQAVAPATISALAEGVLKTMLLQNVMAATAVLLVLGLAAFGGSVVLYQAAARQGPPTQREQPPPAGRPAAGGPATPKADLARLQGTWRVVSLESDGLRFGQGRPEIRGARAVITTKLTLVEVRDGREDRKELQFKLDPARRPKEIDLTVLNAPGGEVLRGIYEVDGESLKLCFVQDAGASRPTDLTANAGSRRWLYTFRREGVSQE